MSPNRYYVGLDVGGTGIKASIITQDGQLVQSSHEPTTQDAGPDHGLKLMKLTVERCLEKAGIPLSEVGALGAGVPGIIDLKKGMILNAVNLRGWKDVAVREYLEKTFGLPVAFLNDANAAALGEAWMGAGKGSESMVLLTLGTGIGGGIIYQGRVIEGKHGLAGEIGHTRIEMRRPRPCSCGQFGCLEAYAGASSVLKRAYEALAEDFNQISNLHSKADAKTLSCKDVFDAASDGDPLADRLVEETALALALGLVNVLHFFDPEKIVLGGGMIGAGEDFLNRVKWFVADQAFPQCASRESICYATLGTDAGILGAAVAARQICQSSFSGYSSTSFS